VEFTPFTPFTPFDRKRSAWRSMTIAECIRIVETFEFRGGISMWKPKLTAVPWHLAGAESVRIAFSILVPHKAGLEPISVSVATTWSLEAINESLLPFDARVLDVVRGLIEHEMHESIFIDGRQIIDPHKENEP
jgi:hypothetical protein